MNLVYRSNNPTTLVLAVLVILGMLGAWNFATSHAAVDYYVMWGAASVVDEETRYNIYQDEGRYRLGRILRQRAMDEDPSSRRAAAASSHSMLNSTGTPLLYSVVGLLSTGDYSRDQINWQTLSIVLFVLAVLIFGKVLGFPLSVSMVLVLPALAWFGPFRSDISFGNVNSIQLGLMALTAWFASRWPDLRFVAVAGFLAAFLAALKPNVGPVAVLLLAAWLMRGQLREFLATLVGMTLAALCIVILTLIHFGTLGIWFDWLGQMPGLMKDAHYSSMVNLGLTQLTPWNLSASQQAGVALGICGLFLGLTYFGRRRAGLSWGQAQKAGEDRVQIENIQLIASSGIITLLVSSLVWDHYLVLLMPLVLVALRPWSNPCERGWGSVILHRCLPVLAFVLLLDGPLLAWTDLENLEYLYYTTMAATLILLFVLFWQWITQDARIPGALKGEGHSN